MNNLDLLNLCHQQAHAAEHNPEDTVFVSMTRRDIWLLTFATLLVSMSLDCLDEECGDLMERLAELIEVQKTNWGSNPDAPAET